MINMNNGKGRTNSFIVPQYYVITTVLCRVEGALVKGKRSDRQYCNMFAHIPDDPSDLDWITAAMASFYVEEIEKLLDAYDFTKEQRMAVIGRLMEELGGDNG